MKTLRELYYGKINYYLTDKGTFHSYIDVYNELFKHFQNKKINIFELGVLRGDSLKLWCDYFENANIIGYDNGLGMEALLLYQQWESLNFNKRISFILKDVNDIQSDEFKNTPLTIAIDDGSHLLDEQIKFINIIYPQIIEGGLLIVEDIQNISKEKFIFESLGYPFEVIDLKKRYDDVLLVFRK